MVQSKDFKNCVNIAGSNFLPLHGTNTKIEKYYLSEVLASAYSELKITFYVNEPGFLSPYHYCCK